MIFDRLFERRSLEDPSVPLTGRNLHEYIGDVGGDGIGVSPVSAMRLAAVYSAIYVLSSSIAQLPLAVMRRNGDRVDAARDHAAWEVLHDSTNEWQTSYKFRESVQSAALGWGNGFGRTVRSPKGELRSIEYCAPSVTTLAKSLSSGRWVYLSTDEDGRQYPISVEDMVHIRALGRDGRMGVSPIMQHAETIGLGLAAQRFGRDFFEGGAQARGLLTPKGDLNDSAWERLKKVWPEAVARLARSKSKTLLLPSDLEYRQLTIPPEDAQFIETRKLTRSEIASIYNLPPHMIGDLERATFTNVTEQAIQYVRHSAMPWVVNWEQELNRRVFTAAERRAGFYVKFNLAGLMRGTPKDRALFYHYAIHDGWMSRNEVRVFEDMNPVDGLDEMLVSVNARPLDELLSDENGNETKTRRE